MGTQTVTTNLRQSKSGIHCTTRDDDICAFLLKTETKAELEFEIEIEEELEFDIQFILNKILSFMNWVVLN